MNQRSEGIAACVALVLSACSASPSTTGKPADAGTRDAGPDTTPAAGSGSGGQSGAHSGGAGAAGHGGGGNSGGAAGSAASSAGGGAGKGQGGTAAEGGSGDMTQPGMTLLVGAGDYGLRGWSSDGMTWSYCGDKASGSDEAPNLLRNIGYGDGVFIAVGGNANSMVMRSLDGAHWQEDVHPTTSCKGESYPSSCTNWMGGIAYLDGVWVAGGGNGALMRSSDGGVTWTGLGGHFVSGKHIRSMGAGSGVFIAGTDGGGLAVSSDQGDSWTAKTPWSGAASDAVLDVAYGGGAFIAYSWSETTSNRSCFISTDKGDTWSACDAMVKASASFVFDGTQWVTAVSGGYATSPDAKTWTKHSASNVPGDLLFDGEVWFGRGGSNVSRGDSLDSFVHAGTGVPDFRAWTIGKVLPSTTPAGSVCVDNR